MRHTHKKGEGEKMCIKYCNKRDEDSQLSFVVLTVPKLKQLLKKLIVNIFVVRTQKVTRIIENEIVPHTTELGFVRATPPPIAWRASPPFSIEHDERCWERRSDVHFNPLGRPQTELDVLLRHVLKFLFAAVVPTEAVR